MTNESTNRRRILSGASLLLLGVMFVVNPLTHLVSRGTHDTPVGIAMRGFVAPLHMALMVGAVIAITQLLRKRADRTGLTAGALTVMGWAVGIRILLLGQLESLPNGRETLGRLFDAAPIVLMSIVPFGLLFPIGIITLGVTLAVTRGVPRPLGILLAVGGLLFPIGRIGHFGWALVSCDLLLGAAFALIGWQVLTRKEAWEQ